MAVIPLITIINIVSRINSYKIPKFIKNIIISIYAFIYKKKIKSVMLLKEYTPLDVYRFILILDCAKKNNLFDSNDILNYNSFDSNNGIAFDGGSISMNMSIDDKNSSYISILTIINKSDLDNSYIDVRWETNNNSLYTSKNKSVTIRLNKIKYIKDNTSESKILESSIKYILDTGIRFAIDMIFMKLKSV